MTPLREWKGWEKGVLLAGVGFAAIMVLSAISGGPQGTQERVANQAEQEAIDDGAQLRADIEAFTGAIATRGSTCGEAISTVAPMLGDIGSNRVSGYAAAQSARDSCMAAWMGAGKIALPEVDDEALEKQFAETLDTCRLSLFVRKDAAEAIMALFDAPRPSTIASAGTELEDANRREGECVAMLKALEAAAPPEDVNGA